MKHGKRASDKAKGGRYGGTAKPEGDAPPETRKGDAKPASALGRAKRFIETHTFVLVVVRDSLGRFVAVQEPAVKKGLWYLPAGRVEFKESLEAAALRETEEEAGLAIRLDGIIRFEYSPAKYKGTGVFATKLRVVFLASPTDEDVPLKTIPDEESTKARWVTVDEFEALPLRAKEIVNLFRYVRDGGPIYPLSLLCPEGTAFALPLK